MLIGNILGLLAGYNGGLADGIIMRSADFVFALPALLVAIVVIGIVGGGTYLAVGMLVFLFCPVDTRLVRAATLEQRNRPYVEAARTLGLSRRRIMFRHIWPNVLPIAVANATLAFAFALVALSSLSFLGIGVSPGTADWGRMLSDSQTLLFQNPATALAPGIALVLTAAAVNVIGDWLFERLSDRGQVR
jgi:peptide/nickel transport system permease protein